MIHVDSLHLRLPAGFQHRAQNIAHLVTTSLGDVTLFGKHHLEHLSTSAIQISRETTDIEIAHSIATGIVTSLKEQR